jgi:hypothetical protein
LEDVDDDGTVLCSVCADDSAEREARAKLDAAVEELCEALDARNVNLVTMLTEAHGKAQRVRELMKKAGK